MPTRDSWSPSSSPVPAQPHRLGSTQPNGRTRSAAVSLTPIFFGREEGRGKGGVCPRSGLWAAASKALSRSSPVAVSGPALPSGATSAPSPPAVPRSVPAARRCPRCCRAARRGEGRRGAHGTTAEGAGESTSGKGGGTRGFFWGGSGGAGIGRGTVTLCSPPPPYPKLSSGVLGGGGGETTNIWGRHIWGREREGAGRRCWEGGTGPGRQSRVLPLPPPLPALRRTAPPGAGCRPGPCVPEPPTARRSSRRCTMAAENRSAAGDGAPWGLPGECRGAGGTEGLSVGIRGDDGSRVGVRGAGRGSARESWGSLIQLSWVPPEWPSAAGTAVVSWPGGSGAVQGCTRRRLRPGGAAPRSVPAVLRPAAPGAFASPVPPLGRRFVSQAGRYVRFRLCFPLVLGRDALSFATLSLPTRDAQRCAEPRAAKGSAFPGPRIAYSCLRPMGRAAAHTSFPK